MVTSEPKQSAIDSVIAKFSNGHFQSALDEALSLLVDFPKNALLHNITGACYMELGEYKFAIKSFDKAIAINTEYAKAYYNLGAAYHELSQYEESIKSYERSIVIDSDYAEAHNNLGNVYRDAQQHDNAILSYEKAISISPDYVEAQYSLAMTYKDLDQLEAMIQHLEKVIAINPGLAEVHSSIGLGLYELGQLKEAVLMYQKALNIKPDNSEVCNNLGNAFIGLGNPQEAVNSYQKALKINPDYPAFHNNLGNAYKEMGKLEEAVKSFNEALHYNPDNVESLNNLGIALFESGEIQIAVKTLKKAIELKPDYEDTYLNLSEILKKNNQNDEAIKCLKSSITINPNNIDIYNNLGALYYADNLLEEALLTFESAIKINPNVAEVFNNIGNTLKDLERFDEAFESYEKALNLNEESAEFHNNFGSLLSENLSRHDDAIKSFKKAISIEPLFFAAHLNLAHTFFEIQQFDEAIQAYISTMAIKSDLSNILSSLFNAKMNCCNWDDFQILLNTKDIKIRSYNNLMVFAPFTLMGLIDDPALQRKTAELDTNGFHPKNTDLPITELYPKHPKIRIGYFSADFSDHPVALLTAGLYEEHDRDHFEIHAFSLVPDNNDEMNLRIKAGVDHFHNVKSMSNIEIVNLVRSLEIDIAVDLSGITANARTGIFAMSVAPVQLSYIGYLGTMGADYYDYLIADPMMIPKESQKHYVEKIAYLPSFQVNDSKDLPPDLTMTRKDLGLPETGFVFCCFNNTYKITPTTFDGWARILNSVQDSVLILYASNELSKANLIKEIKQRGIAAERLIFGENLERAKYLARYRVADLFLDTHPYNAGTTASDALKMGLPMLTMKGKSYQARMGASIVNAVNLPELITNTQEEYESLAIELATNPDKLKAIKDKLANNLPTAPLYDTKLFAKNIESAYTQMYERHHQGLEPDHIYISIPK